MGKPTPPRSLPTSAPKLASPRKPNQRGRGRKTARNIRGIGGIGNVGETIAVARKEKAVRPAPTMLGPEQSAAVREQLLAEIGQLQSPDEAADWVHKNLSIKNTLTAADADLVEAPFPREARDNRGSVHHGRRAITGGAEARPRSFG